MATKTPTTSEILDSRDLQELADYLRDDEDMDDEERQAVADIDAMADEVEEWKYGAALIREDYFEEYAQELAEDIGAIPDRDNNWPLYCIDWEWAARELRQDYTEVTYLGVTYYVRA